MNRSAREKDSFQACDLCGDRKAQLILVSDRLDGPLVQCRTCKLYFVDAPSDVLPSNQSGNNGAAMVSPVDMKDAVAEMTRLAQRARDLNLVDPHVEESERPWRELSSRERLEDLSRFISQGRLLEVGSSTGEFLAVARERFEVVGVEADAGSSRVASERGLTSINGTVSNAGFAPSSFDVAVLYHTIEHLPSPSATMDELNDLICPGGWLVLETPDISTIWFRLLGHRWRQFIPDHRYFYTPETIDALCRRAGFAIQEIRSVGKSMSFRLFASRVGRYQASLGGLLSKVGKSAAIEDRTLRLRLGDVMRVYASRR